MRYRNSILTAVFVGAIGTSVLAAAALVGGLYVIHPTSINGGGGSCSGGNYAITCSVAQPAGVGMCTSSDGKYSVGAGFWHAVTGGPRLIASTPENGESLWRSRKNIVRLTFNGNIQPPQAGQVLIQEMLAGGAYGKDLSADFAFTVEKDGNQEPRILRIQEKGSVLTHRKWYAIRNVGGWSDVADFTVQYVVQVGDTNNDGHVLNSDVGPINQAIPALKVADNGKQTSRSLPAQCQR